MLQTCKIILVAVYLRYCTKQGGIYTRAPGDFAPKMQKRALENEKRAPEIWLQWKSLFNVADLVNGMWKAAPENKNLIFPWYKDYP